MKKQLDTILSERNLGSSKYDDEISRLIGANSDLYNHPDPVWRNKARAALGAPKTLDDVLNESVGARKSTSAAATTTPPKTDYQSMSVEELRALKKQRGL